MSTPGRKPKPTHLKVLHGNPGKRPINEAEPKPRPIAPKCPSWLDPVAKREWRRVVPELEKLGLLTCVDGAALEGYCQAYARWVAAERFLQDHGKKTGFMFRTPQGYLQQLPQVSIAQKYLQLVKAFCAEFGLTPSSRSRISTPGGKPDEDPFEEFLKGGQGKEA